MFEWCSQTSNYTKGEQQQLTLTSSPSSTPSMECSRRHTINCPPLSLSLSRLLVDALAFRTTPYSFKATTTAFVVDPNSSRPQGRATFAAASAPSLMLRVAVAAAAADAKVSDRRDRRYRAGDVGTVVRLRVATTRPVSSSTRCTTHLLKMAMVKTEVGVHES